MSQGAVSKYTSSIKKKNGELMIVYLYKNPKTEDKKKKKKRTAHLEVLNTARS